MTLKRIEPNVDPKLNQELQAISDKMHKISTALYNRKQERIDSFIFNALKSRGRTDQKITIKTGRHALKVATAYKNVVIHVFKSPWEYTEYKVYQNGRLLAAEKF